MVAWADFFRQHGIELRGDAPAALPQDSDLEKTEQRLKVKLPESYRAFCKEIGPGRLGDLLDIWVPWHAKGFFQAPVEIGSRLKEFKDGNGKPRTSLEGKAIQLGLVVLGAPPIPRPISGKCAELFFAISEPTTGGEFTIYALDHRTPQGQPPRLVKLSKTFPDLVAEVFVNKALAKAPLVSAPAPDQFEPWFQRVALP
jgi:hypothetical protein